jgi:hypothetical protein
MLDSINSYTGDSSMSRHLKSSITIGKIAMNPHGIGPSLSCKL